MNKFIYTLLIPFLTIQSIALAHCQVPCGIYDDTVRVMQIREDFYTIKKAMSQINILSGKSDPLSMNQLTRWVMTKEKKPVLAEFRTFALRKCPESAARKDRQFREWVDKQGRTHVSLN